MSVHALLHHFQDKLDKLKQAFVLRDATGCRKPLLQVQDMVCELEFSLAVLRNEMKAQKQALARTLVLKEQICQMVDNVNYVQENLPVHLPTPQHTQAGVSDGALCPRMPEAAKTTIDKPPPKQVPIKQAVNKHKVAPSIDLLTVEEFESAPKYMKGRIKYNQICVVVQEFNKALAAKHKTLTTPRTKQSVKIKTQIVQYKEQENKDTDGFFFIMDSDISEHTRLKLDTNGRNCLTILRHCGRIRELRGGRLTRYLVPSHQLF